MPSNLSYQEKLKDPRWQKMRLLILQRDDWKCRICRSADKTLHVHHFYYVRGYEPWDYPELALATLCSDCHTSEHESGSYPGEVIDALKILGAFNTDFAGLLGHLHVSMYGVRDTHLPKQLSVGEWHAVGAVLGALVGHHRENVDLKERCRQIVQWLQEGRPGGNG